MSKRQSEREAECEAEGKKLKRDECAACPRETPSKQGTARAEQGTAHTEPGTARTGRGTACAEQGTAHAEQGTANAEQGTAHIEQDTARMELGTAHTKQGTSLLTASEQQSHKETAVCEDSAEITEPTAEALCEQGQSRSAHALKSETEQERLKRVGPWRQWGPYLSERQWGTVREDRSSDGSCWEHFPHEEAVYRAYECGEDGLLGICDDNARLCHSLALWNGNDAILKERLFGLTGKQGNHGEDVKELYYYLEGTPTHSYMRALYKYPQATFPYAKLVDRNAHKTRDQPEYEILDTGVFNDDAYWDVFVEYAKYSPTDILCRYTVHNRGKSAATIHLIPTLWCRNTWSLRGYRASKRPVLQLHTARLPGAKRIVCTGISTLGEYMFDLEKPSTTPGLQVLFTSNETNPKKLSKSSELQNLLSAGQGKQPEKHFKDAFHDCIVNHKEDAVNPENKGTKCGGWYQLTVDPFVPGVVRCRLYLSASSQSGSFGKPFDEVFAMRIKEMEAWYDSLCAGLGVDERLITRQAYAGLCWSKQFYLYNGKHVASYRLASSSFITDSHNSIVALHDPGGGEKKKPAVTADSIALSTEKPPRNSMWTFLRNHDVISMPDKWEFPWYATWDLALHMVPFARIDENFAKSQLLLFLSERYQHPRGQLPAFEFDFGDVNPPLHAWGCMRVYRQATVNGTDAAANLKFLKKCFGKLAVNFDWWVNQKDPGGTYLFGGGFLGMDNVSCMNRSYLPDGITMQQADGTAWMAFFAATMLDMALELAQSDDSYEDMATHYLCFYAQVADAINGPAGLWHDEDGFFYDKVVVGGARAQWVRLQSLVGLVSMLPVLLLTKERYKRLPNFTYRLNRVLHSVTRGQTVMVSHSGKGASASMSNVRLSEDGGGGKGEAGGGGVGAASDVLLSLVSRRQLVRVLKRVLNEDELLSPFGIRSLSKKYSGGAEYTLKVEGQREFTARYTPGESSNDMFGGNSNWRGPVWIPMNYLLLESFDVYHNWHGKKVRVAFPTNSNNVVPLSVATDNVRERLVSLFLPSFTGRRNIHGAYAERYVSDPSFKELLLFYEYFHADTGAGCGASHQTGWTALMATIIQQLHSHRLSAPKATKERKSTH